MLLFPRFASTKSESVSKSAMPMFKSACQLVISASDFREGRRCASDRTNLLVAHDHIGTERYHTELYRGTNTNFSIELHENFWQKRQTDNPETELGSHGYNCSFWESCNYIRNIVDKRSKSHKRLRGNCERTQLLKTHGISRTQRLQENRQASRQTPAERRWSDLMFKRLFGPLHHRSSLSVRSKIDLVTS